MFQRKLVKSGLSSHVIALPKEFIDENKLSAGDTVYLENTRPGELSVKADFKDKKSDSDHKVKEIVVGSRPISHIHYDIIEAYLNNYNEMIIRCNNPAEVKTVKDFIGYLVALEVVQEDNNKVVAKDYLNYKDKEIDRTIRRIESIVCSMIVDLKCIKDDPSMASAIYERDYHVNRMGFLAMRILHSASKDPSLASHLGLGMRDIMRLWSANIYLEKIGDECKRMGKFIESMDKKKYDLRALDRLLDDMLDLYRKTFIAIHGLDKDLMSANIGRRKQIAQFFDKKESKRTATPEVLSLMDQMLSHLADINRIYRYTGE